jgi:hypothetical protein
LTGKPRKIFLAYLAFLSIAGGIVVYLSSSKQGPGVSTDAAMMMSAAENLLKGRGLVSYQGVALTQFPPLYSLLLALGGLIFRQDVFIVGWVLNIVVFSAIVWVSGLYFHGALAQWPLLPYFASFIVCSSASLVQISANIASDPLFLLLVLFFLMVMSAYLRSGRARFLGLAAAVALVSCFERYAGLSLVITGAVLTAFHSRHDRARAILMACAFAVVTGLPIVLWGVLHNVPTSGTMFGQRLPALALPNFTAGVEKLLYWFIPLRFISFVGPLVLLAAILAAWLLLLVIMKELAIFRGLLAPAVLPSLIFLLVYGAVLTFDISYFELKGVDTDRVHIILLPVLLVVVSILSMPVFAAASARLGRRWPPLLAVLLFVAWSGYPLSKTYDYVRRSMANGDVSPYNSINKANVTGSALSKYLMSLDIGQKRVFSNGGGRAWFILRTRVRILPVIKSKDRVAYLRQHSPDWPGGGKTAYLVWFNDESYTAAEATPQELSAIAKLRLLYSDAQGTVYLASSR